MLGNTRRTRPQANTENKTKPTKTTTTMAKDRVALQTAGKRQGDMLQDPTQKRRAALGDVTNAGTDKPNIKMALKKSKLPATKPVVPVQKVKESKASKEKQMTTTKSTALQKVPSSDSLAEDESALSLIASSQGSSSSSSQEFTTETPSDISCKGVEDLVPVEETPTADPEIDDIDKENMQDPVQVAMYAWDIFQYYKERELQFKIEPYMGGQKFITSSMRAILIDWLVEVQENFELNHETLYLAVKLTDMYVSRTVTAKESLQLVGAVSLFIAAKFDERCPPLVEDFLYICDDAYKRKEFLDMERIVLHAIGFDIGMPLSYRFLRRYAKCGRANMETLTLSRYILEMSLMEYDFVHRRESLMAAASLLLALRMKKAGEWTKTLIHHTGYEETELMPIMKKLNHYISNPPKQLATIKSKYSHRVFYEVAKTAPLPESELQ